MPKASSLTTSLEGESSSVTDACASLVMDIQAAWKEKKIYSVLACDVQGFFDNVGHAHLHSNLAKMGIPLPLQAWVTSFVSNWFVAISFDGFCGPMVLIYGISLIFMCL